jgi:WW domain-binding protein 2
MLLILETIWYYPVALQLIFATPPGTATTSFESLSVPLLSILSASYEQPMFGANYISFEIKPSPEGGLTKGTKAEIRLNDRGILQFWEQLQKPRERAIYEKRSKADEDDEGLRACFPTIITYIH